MLNAVWPEIRIDIQITANLTPTAMKQRRTWLLRVTRNCSLCLLTSVLVAVAGVAPDSSAAELGSVQRLTSADAVPEGLTKADWASIRAVHEAQQQALVAAGSGYQARNFGQQWLTKFDGRGFVTHPNDGSWTWGLSLQSYGFSGAPKQIGESARQVKTERQRLTYSWDGNLEEWFVNDERGLEHGFTVLERPAVARAGDEQLEFHLAVRGDLVAEVAPDAQAVRFVSADGAAVINYGGLNVWDADGRRLPAWFAEQDNRSSSDQQRAIRICVDERGARFPITVDPIAQQAYLKASNTNGGDSFGTVAISGDTVVVGALQEDSSATGVNGNQSDNSATDSGAV
jgi:hypothetical protein